jgi:peptidoglycan/LPS O-acetylase OafA/YrhL
MPLPTPDSSGVLRAAAAVWYRGGWVGVDLFFVLSGFLIAGLLLREHEEHHGINLRRFFIRRGLKIYPSFYIFFAVTVFVRVFCGEPLRRRALVSEALFMQNYGGANLWGHTWSLAVEEHFYLLLPLALCVMARRRGPGDPFRSLPLWIAGAAAAVFALRVINAYLTPGQIERSYYETHFRIDSLLFGVLLSYCFRRRSEQFIVLCRTYRWPLLFTGIGLFAPAFLFELNESFYHHTLGLTCSYLGAGAILSASLPYSMSAGTLSRAMTFVGARSYSIYLWHVPVSQWLVPWARHWAGSTVQSSWLWIGIYVLGAVAVGTAFAWIVEYPVLRLRDRLFPSRGGPLSVTRAPQLVAADLKSRGYQAGDPGPRDPLTTLQRTDHWVGGVDDSRHVAVVGERDGDRAPGGWCSPKGGSK